LKVAVRGATITGIICSSLFTLSDEFSLSIQTIELVVSQVYGIDRFAVSDIPLLFLERDSRLGELFSDCMLEQAGFSSLSKLKGVLSVVKSIGGISQP
jgi:hypothetical protein